MGKILLKDCISVLATTRVGLTLVKETLVDLWCVSGNAAVVGINLFDKEYRIKLKKST